MQIDKYNKKILQYRDKDLFVIFYSPECPYCQKAIELLKTKNMSFKGYNINNINGGLEKLLYYLNLQEKKTKFNVNHKTKPIIFYKGTFIGGFSELEPFINKIT